MIKDVKEEELIDFILPKEEDVIDYIITKEFYRHDTVELQEKFLGKRLPVRENPKLFTSFDNILRKARKHIANTYNIEWDNGETKTYGTRTHVTVYKIKKSENQLNQKAQTNIENDSGNLKLISLNDFKRVEPPII